MLRSGRHRATTNNSSSVSVTATCALVLRKMLSRPKGSHFCDGLAAELGRPRGTIRKILYKFEWAGWLTSEYEDRGRYQARRYFSFTPRGLKEARDEIETWDFTDE